MIRLNIVLYILLFSFFGHASVWANPIKIAAIGDSVTEGLGLENPEREAYPSVLQSLLGDDYVVGNFGHSGATLLRKGHRPYVQTPQFKEAINFHADIAVIHLGLNDTDPRNFPNYRDEFVSDYLWLIDTLRTNNPDIQIFIANLSSIFTGHPRFSSSTFTWYHAVRELISQVANASQLPVIDLYAALHNRPDLITDNPTLHPNKQGAALIAKTVQEHITGNFGGLQLPPVFGEYMVVQRDKPFQIWGIANAGTTVQVQWAGQTQKAIAGVNGHWEMTFPAAALNPNAQTLTIKNGDDERVFSEVLIGDVWLAAGQSNMEFKLRDALGGDSLANLADKQKNIRLLQFDSYARTDDIVWDSITLKKANELDFFDGQWERNKKETALNFSAVAYSFATEIAESEDIPIGIINISVGGSPQLAWLPRLSLEKNTDFVQSLHPWRQSDYLMGWCRMRANKNLELTDSPFQQHPYAPAYIYEAGLARLIPFALRGMIWYQGESDAENVELYSRLFPYFIEEIRAQWNDDFPFYYVQLSSIKRPSWPYFRDEQRRLLQIIPNSGMAVTSDIGDAKDVHPREKLEVGHRLAQWALSRQYKQNVTPSGPLFKDYRITKNVIEISFDYNRGLRPSGKEQLRGFAFQTLDGRFIPSQASIRNDQVVVTLPNERIKALVYGWEPVSEGNLVNQAGLPASTFRVVLK